MPKLTKRAYCLVWKDGQTDPNYRKSFALKNRNTVSHKRMKKKGLYEGNEIICATLSPRKKVKMIKSLMLIFCKKIIRL